jgi:hypothetical protein
MRKPLFDPKAGLREALRAEIRDELTALERYEAEHGSFPELVRAQYERDDGAAPRSSLRR